MDYKVIFSDLSKIRIILNNLLKSNMHSDIQLTLNKLTNNLFKKVVGIQYIYLYSKRLNILHSNKSTQIIILEDNLKLISNKNIDEIVQILNYLGYIDLLLILLNISKKLLNDIIIYINKKNNLNIKENIIDVSTINYNKNNDEFINEIVNKIVNKISFNLKKNISNSIEDTNQNTNIPKLDNEHIQEIDINKEIEKLKVDHYNNNILHKYIKKKYKNNKDENDEDEETVIELNKNDENLLNLLD